MQDKTLDLNRIPQHVAIIMDGNGRWAKNRGMIRVQGHNAGMLALKKIVKQSDIWGIRYLTVYAFSTENWKRPVDEVSGIFKLVVRYVDSEINELDENNVKVNILGDISQLPDDARESVEYALRRTENNTGLTFNIALNYGGRADIVNACQKLIEESVKNGSVNDITEKDISDRLWTAGIPDPDLIIRTGGESRLSNFLTWQSAYSEIVICSTLWPDFDEKAYEDSLIEFQGRDRRFGGIKS